VAAGLGFALLAGCDPVSLGESRQHLPDPFDTVQNTNLDPRFPQQSGQPTPPPKIGQGTSYYGHEATADTPTTPAPGAHPADDGEGYELNFENAAVTTVAKVILGDILGAGYTIDPRVQGTVTIASGRPVPKNDLVLVLENALRMSNVVLVADAGGGYRLIPGGDAQGAGATMAANDQQGGYGISAVPLHYTAAPTILKLLDSFAIKPGMARADTGHNLILVQGSGPERQTAVDAILSFDVDWMRGQSVGIYPVENAAPDAMIKELEKIMQSSEGGLNEGLVTLQPIPRLNAVLVVTKKPNLLHEAALWIKRLDKTDNAGSAVRVYRLRYADARQVARVLSDLFGSKSQGLDSAVNQIAPGAGVTTTSTDALGNPGNGTSPFTSNGQTGLGSTIGGTPGAGTVGAATTGATPGGIGASTFGTTSGVGAAPGTGQTGLAGDLSGTGQQQQGQTSINIPGLRIAADVANNSLVIFANQENYKLIEQTLGQLDRPQLQVAIHATIAEVTLNNDLQYGVEYFLQGNSVSFGFTTSNSTPNLSPILPGANLILGPEASPKVVINALRTVTDVKVLSAPSLVVVDNQVASLQVGDQVPVSTGTASVLASATTSGNTIVNSISYLNTGVILQVLPRINANGNVNLQIQQEISNVANNANATTLTPTVSQRKIKSAVSVASGQTVLLGGLITETQSRTRNGIPVLEEIPILGDAFATNDRSTTRTELIIFIEPQIIRDSIDAAKVAEELRAKLRGSADNAFPPGPSLFRDPQFVR
jgi:general secretion pathway protein D